MTLFSLYPISSRELVNSAFYVSPCYQVRIGYSRWSKIINGIYQHVRATEFSIYNSVSGDNYWIFYEEDIPYVEQLFWILRMTPPVVRALWLAKLKQDTDAITRHSSKLEMLLKRLNSLVFPTNYPDHYVFLHKHFYLRQPFTHFNTENYTLHSFRDEYRMTIQSFINYPIFIREMDPPGLCKLFTIFNDQMSIFRRHQEEFFIFLRLFRDLRNYMLIRKVTGFSIEEQQIAMLRTSLHSMSKHFFKPLGYSDATQACSYNYEERE